MYHALLPPKVVKSLKTEYRVRLLIVVVFFVSSAILVSTCFLFPSYLSAGMAERAASVSVSSVGTTTDTASIDRDFSAATSLVSAISSTVSPDLSQIVLRVDALLPDDISLTSFDVAYSGGASSTVTIEGTALGRDSLVAFRKILEDTTPFSNVEIPISDLAPSSYLQFSLQMSAGVEPPKI